MGNAEMVSAFQRHAKDNKLGYTADILQGSINDFKRVLTHMEGNSEIKKASDKFMEPQNYRDLAPSEEVLKSLAVRHISSCLMSGFAPAAGLLHGLGQRSK